MRLAMLLLLSTAVLTAAQQPPSPTSPPQFRTGIDLLRLQVSVLHRDGTVVSDLREGDFAVTLDGKPRQVRFVRFYGVSPASNTIPAEAHVAPPAPQSSALNTAGNPGRVVVFIVDRDSIHAGGGKPLLMAAGKLLDSLTRFDGSGFISLPAGRLVVGRQHHCVRDAIANAVGVQRPHPNWRYHVDLRDALAFERRDQTAIRHVIERECLNNAGDCGDRVAEQAREMLLLMRAETRATLQALRQVIDGLREIRAPKLVLLISGGVWFEVEALTEFNVISRQAAAAQTVVHTLYVDQFAFDAQERGRGPSLIAAPERQEGLRQIAASTGGVFYQAVGTAEGVFNRLATEVTNFYQLGIEVAPGDLKSENARGAGPGKASWLVRTQPP